MKELLIRQKLDELDEQVVRRAEALVDKTPDITDEKRGLEDRQIRNVLAVAEDTQSVAVVENFVKYQIGRCKSQEGWRSGEAEGQGFGEKLLCDLKQIQKWAKSKAGDDITAQDLAIRLVRRYLGYLARYFKYAQARQEQEKRGRR